MLTAERRSGWYCFCKEEALTGGNGEQTRGLGAKTQLSKGFRIKLASRIQHVPFGILVDLNVVASHFPLASLANETFFAAPDWIWKGG